MRESTEANPQENRACARVRLLFWVIGILAAATQAIAYRQWVNGDTISYVDMSDAVTSHDLSRLVTGHWSPLYPLLIGVADAVIRPSVAWEFPVVHLVNFLCFLFAFAAFEFLLRSMWESKTGPNAELGPTLPRWAFLTIGYSLFLWASIAMITLMRPHPDMLMSAFLYLAGGLLVRMRKGPARWQAYAALGCVLGFGYLSKVLMFPFSILILGMTLFFAGRLSQKLKGIAVAGLCFAVVAGPFVFAISRMVRHPSFGESGTVNFLVDMDQVSAHNRNVGGATGWFVHPMKLIIAGDPPALSFDRPLAVTYAFWYDPYYWHEGVRPVFYGRRQLAIIRANLRQYAGIMAPLGGLLLALLLLAWAAGVRRTVAALRAFWPLSLLGAAALAGYATLHIEERYIGAFLALLGVALAFGFSFSRPLPDRAVKTIVAIVAINLAVLTALHTRRDYRDNVSKTQLRDPEAAVALHKLGIAPGDAVASITPWVASGWARLARVRIIAEIQHSRAEEFWKVTPERQSAVLGAFAGAGCKAVVSWIGDRQTPAGWLRLDSSAYIFRALP